MKNFWREKRVFITGASGLVGYHLTKKVIDQGGKVVVLIRDSDPQSELFRTKLIDKSTVVNGSLEDINSIKRAINDHEIEYLFHLGAQTIVGAAMRDPLATFEANIRGTYNLLEACRAQKELLKGIVIASSDKAYGTSKTLPYKEDFPLVGSSPYDVSKSCTDLIAASYHKSFGLPIAIARCGNIFGRGDLNWSRIVPGTIKSLYFQEAPILRSDGTNLRDYIFVEDVVAAYLALAENMEKIKGEAFNFGPNRPISVLELVKIIQKLMKAENLELKILNTAKSEIHSQYLDWEKAKTVLKWAPKFSLEDGLNKTIEWYTAYLEQVHEV